MDTPRTGALHTHAVPSNNKHVSVLVTPLELLSWSKATLMDTLCIQRHHARRILLA